ncbi:hypothetical protein Slu03_07750 [Sediminihabitans luteus]|nr:DUF2746 domain-containing protein [Sediminihabitans luteus]GII98397.1 hypothetical protein Slu03_07750 [Sediminihabitans luteus]
MADAPPDGTPWWAWFIVAVVVATGPALAIFGPSLVRRLNRPIAEQVEVVREQVQNSHETNFRDDLDRVLAAVERIEQNQHRHDGEIAGIRDDVRAVAADGRQTRVDVEVVARRIDEVQASSRVQHTALARHIDNT